MVEYESWSWIFSSTYIYLMLQILGDEVYRDASKIKFFDIYFHYTVKVKCQIYNVLFKGHLSQNFTASTYLTCHQKVQGTIPAITNNLF